MSDNTLSKKGLITGLIIGAFSIIICLFFAFIGSVNAEGLITDDFESYDIGGLRDSGNPNWQVDKFTDENEASIISSMECYGEGGQCLKLNATTGGFEVWNKKTASSTSGSITWRQKIDEGLEDDGLMMVGNYVDYDGKYTSPTFEDGCGLIEVRLNHSDGSYYLQVWQNARGGDNTTTTFEIGGWNTFKQSWDFATSNKFSVYVDNELIDSFTCDSFNYNTISGVWFSGSNPDINYITYIDDLGISSYVSPLNIISPVSGSSPTSTFDIIAEYTEAGGYNKLMVLFEDWNASSTCPEQGTSEYDSEVSEGWLNYQSNPYFSNNNFASTTGTTTISVDDLPKGGYNCIFCYYVNTIDGSISENLCPNYSLDISEYLQPDYIPNYQTDFSDWSDYYASSSDKWATSTPLFTNITSTFQPLLNWIAKFSITWKDKFDVDFAKEKGKDIGDAVAMIRSYTESVDDLFGGLPISTFLIFYIIISLGIIIFRIVKSILQIIIP